jgi:hypothetical protein
MMDPSLATPQGRLIMPSDYTSLKKQIPFMKEHPLSGEKEVNNDISLRDNKIKQRSKKHNFQYQKEEGKLT